MPNEYLLSLWQAWPLRLGLRGGRPGHARPGRWTVDGGRGGYRGRGRGGFRGGRGASVAGVEVALAMSLGARARAWPFGCGRRRRRRQAPGQGHLHVRHEHLPHGLHGSPRGHDRGRIHHVRAFRRSTALARHVRPALHAVPSEVARLATTIASIDWS